MRQTRIAATLAVLALLAAAALPAAALGCSGGHSFTWTGEGDGHSWSDAENWSPQEEAPPKSGDTAIIQGSEEAEAEVEGGTEGICDLTLEGADAFLTGTALTVEGDFTWEGGQGEEAASELEGNLTVDGSTTIGHNVILAGGKLSANGSLDVNGGTELTLADGSAEIVSSGGGDLGGGIGGLLGEGTTIQSNSSSGSDDNGKLVVNGGLQLSGDIESPHLDLELGNAGTVDLDGNTWTLPGLSFSRWKGGSEVKSSSEGGVIAFTNLAQLLVDGSVTVGEDALVSMRDTSVLTDGEPEFPGEPAGGQGLLRGDGTLEWQSGSLERNLTLAPEFHTVLDAEGVHEMASEPDTRLVNHGKIDVQSGELLVDSEPAKIENWGTIAVHAGATLACNSACRSDTIDNAPGAEIEVLGPAPLQPPATEVQAIGIGLHNNGDLRIGEGLTLLLQNDAVASLAEDTLSGGGDLRLGEEGKANVVETTTLRDGTVLSIDGYEAELHAGIVNSEGEAFTGVLNAAHAGDGVLQWAEGGLEGSLLTDNQLQTYVIPSTEGATIDAESYDTHVPDRNPTSITFASPTHVDGVSVEIDSDQNGDAVSVDGPMTIAGPGGFGTDFTGADGVIVGPNGSLTAEGAARVEAPLTVLGELSVPGGSSLRATFGYDQTGSGAETLLTGGTIDTREEGEAELHALQLDGGSLRGNGTVHGDVDVSGATVSPSADGSTPGKLQVDGPYDQQLGGTLAVHLAGAAASEHDQLSVSRKATLSGTLAAVTDAGYAPAVPTTISDVLDANDTSGTFANVSSSGAPAYTAWQASYRPGAVDLGLVSTGTPPAESPTPSASPPPKKPGFRGSRSGVKLKGGSHVSAKGVIAAKLVNGNAFPVAVASISVRAMAGGKARRRRARSKGPIVGGSRGKSTVPASASAPIAIRLNARGRAMLHHRNRLDVEIVVVLSAPDGTRTTLHAHRMLKPKGS